MRSAAFFLVVLFTGGIGSAAARDLPLESFMQPAPDPWESIAAHYRRDTIGERLVYRATGVAGNRSSEVILRISHSAPHAPVVRLDLGNLIVYADSTRLVAVHAANTSAYFERTLTDGLTPRVFTESLPPLVLPQLGWALTRDLPRESTWELFGVGRVRVEPGAVDLDLGRGEVPLVVTGLTPGITVNSMSLRRVDSSLALGSFSATYGSGEGATTLTLAPEQLAPADVGEPASWVIDTAGRTRVARLADLKPLPGEVSVGDPCPPLSLVTSAIEGWSFNDAVERLSGLNPQPSGPVWIALIVRVPTDGGTSQVVAHAARGLDNLTREFSIQRMQGIRNVPRLQAHEVVVLELGEVNPQRIAELSGREIVGTESLGERLFSTTGKAVFHRVAPGASAAVIVLDEDQRFAGVVRLDGRMVDASTIESEVRRIVSTQVEAGSSTPAQDGAGEQREGRDGGR